MPNLFLFFYFVAKLLGRVREQESSRESQALKRDWQNHSAMQGMGMELEREVGWKGGLSQNWIFPFWEGTEQPWDEQLRQLWQFYSGRVYSTYIVLSFSGWGNWGLKRQRNSSKVTVIQCLSRDSIPCCTSLVFTCMQASGLSGTCAFRLPRIHLFPLAAAPWFSSGEQSLLY